MQTGTSGSGFNFHLRHHKIQKVKTYLQYWNEDAMLWKAVLGDSCLPLGTFNRLTSPSIGRGALTMEKKSNISKLVYRFI